MGRAYSRYGGKQRRIQGFLVGKHEVRRELGGLRRRRENNIKMALREMGWRHGMDRSGSG
jgi:hypothetical protein